MPNENNALVLSDNDNGTQSATWTPVEEITPDQKVLIGAVDPLSGTMQATWNPSSDAAIFKDGTFTDNGVYDAQEDDCDGYKTVTVNVANSYEASDEGKVVSSGALVAQTARSENITEDGTYDTTENNSVTVAVAAPASDMNAKIDLNSIDYEGPKIEYITEVSFLSDMTQIPDYTCLNMAGLQNIDLNSQLTSIGSQAFYHIGITSLTLPAGITFNGTDHFANCENLDSITFLGNNDYEWSNIEPGSFLGCYPSTINNCPDISDGTFERGNTHLTSLSFSNATTFVNSDFQGSSITQLIIPASVTSIDQAEEDQGYSVGGAFYGCDALETITINKSENSIPGAPWGAPNATVIWNG